MTLVLINDDPIKRQEYEVSVRKLGDTCISFGALEPAWDYLKTHQVDAILTGMGYPYREGDPDSFESNAGDILLILLKSHKKEILVWGTSEGEVFNKGINYPFYKGYMNIG